MMTLAVGGVVLLARGRSFSAGALLAAAIFVKWAVLVLLPVLLLQRRKLVTRRAIVGAAAATAGIAALAFARYGRAWLDALDRLSQQGRRTDGSLGLAPLLRDLGLTHRAILVLLAALFVVGYARCLLDAHRLERTGRAGELFVLTQGWVNPWYAALFVPFVALEDDRLARFTAVALTGYFLADVPAL